MTVERGHGHPDVDLRLLHGLHHRHQSSLSLPALACLFSALPALLLLDLAVGYSQRPALLGAVGVLAVLLLSNSLVLLGRHGKGSDQWGGDVFFLTCAVGTLDIAMKMDGNGRKNPISISVSIFFFGENGIGFENYGFGNRIGIYGHTETNKYGRRARKLN
jgi:hypothetical protein